MTPDCLYTAKVAALSFAPTAPATGTRQVPQTHCIALTHPARSTYQAISHCHTGSVTAVADSNMDLVQVQEQGWQPGWWAQGPPQPPSHAPCA